MVMQEATKPTVTEYYLRPVEYHQEQSRTVSRCHHQGSGYQAPTRKMNWRKCGADWRPSAQMTAKRHCVVLLVEMKTKSLR